MKKIIFLLAFIIQGCESQDYLSKDEKTQELTTSQLEIRSGLAYLPKSKELFTGKFYAYSDTLADVMLRMAIENKSQNDVDKIHHIDGNIKLSEIKKFNRDFKTTYNFKNGVLHGLSQLFCLNDSMEIECGSDNYKNGILSGVHKSYIDKGLLNLVSLKLGDTEESKIQDATKELVAHEDKIEKDTWYNDALEPIKGSYIKAYMHRTEHNSIVLRCRLNYESSAFIFIKSVIIAADNQRFEKRDLSFERNSGYNKIKEWYDFNMLDDDLNIIKAIINSKESIIRFKGDVDYEDYVVTEAEKESLRNVVNAYEALLLLAS